MPILKLYKLNEKFLGKIAPHSLLYDYRSNEHLCRFDLRPDKRFYKKLFKYWKYFLHILNLEITCILPRNNTYLFPCVFRTFSLDCFTATKYNGNEFLSTDKKNTCNHFDKMHKIFYSDKFFFSCVDQCKFCYHGYVSY